MIPKFRVWQIDEKKMYPVQLIRTNSDGSLTVNATDNSDDWNPIQVSGKWKAGKLMLYAPLYDKNNKQLCEGDIVQQFSDDDPYFRYVVLFEGGAFGYQPHGEDYNFISYVENKQFDWIEGTAQSNKIEIIGNAYENPERIVTKNPQKRP